MEKIVKLTVNYEKLQDRFRWITQSETYKLLMVSDEFEFGDLYLHMQELYFLKIESIIDQDKYFKFIIDPGRFSLVEAYQDILKDSLSLLEKQVTINDYAFHGLLDYDDNDYRQITFTIDNQKFETSVYHNNNIHITPIVSTLNKIKTIFVPESNYFFVCVDEIGGIAYVNQKEYLMLIRHRLINIDFL